MIKEQITNLFIGRPRSERRLRRFEKMVHPETKFKHDKIIKWAEKLTDKQFSEEEFLNSKDTIVVEGYKLRKKVLTEFKDKYKNLDLRILIHYPGDNVSVAGKSLFTNLSVGLNHLGVKTELMPWNADTRFYLEKFKPNIFMTSDDKCYLDDINWSEVEKYKKTDTLKLGLTASAGEHSNRPIEVRLEFAKKNNVDFYFCYWDEDYVKNTKGYERYFEKGYKIFSVEFGANILEYFPLPNVKKDLDYVFLASTNRKKRPRYHEYMAEIFKKFYGFYDGPGWSITNKETDFKRDKFIYARSKIGLNLHVDNQLESSNELNERTYMLAACGVTQLIDNPMLLPKKFSDDALFSAKDSKEYIELFDYILKNPQIAQKRALKALQEVLKNLTSFHSAEKFIKNLLTL